MPDTPAWVRDAVFYLIFPDRFASSDRVAKPGPLEPWDAPPTNYGFKGGDLLGVVEHLDHIASLGVNALYLTPVFQSASNHRYHTYDYLAVDPLLGGDAALRELLDRAHERGMRVILDGVFNHTGRGFWAFHHVLETGAGSPYRTWFHFDQEGLADGRPVDAYPLAHLRSGVALDQPRPGEVEGGGGSRSRFGYEAWWDMPALPKLNVGDPAVREYLWGVAEHWLRFGIDGWRLDVPGEIDDRSFWAEFRRRCRAINPDAYLVGEIWQVAPDWVSGDRFDALMNYPLAEAIIGYVGGRGLNEALLRSHHEYGRVTRLDGAQLAARLVDILGAYAPETTAVQLNLLDSHDTPRVLSVLGDDREAFELAILLQATLPGAPCVYYGDEVGVAGGIDPDSRRAFPWDGARWDHDLLGAVRDAFGLRRREPALRADGVEITATAAEGLVFTRRSATGKLAVALNAGEEPISLPLVDQGGTAQPSGSVALAMGRARSTPVSLETVDGRPVIQLPPRSGVVVRLA
ncbi:MAG TPA: glycoside hydrolase family 13 protein [Candidatus Dormibacteraeota bacterium]|nr:glycoside hydrolase family 13 protein [Candidatus Dormibacteraeota bacterium]